MNTMPMTRRSLVTGLAACALLAHSRPVRAQDLKIVVSKDPTCGCCTGWVDHLREAGFSAEVIETSEINRVKVRLGVPNDLASCHTAEIEGYVIEGHVPADAIKRLLSEKPKAKGLAVAGMPMGSPGMEMEGMAPETYEVVLFGPSVRETFARYEGARLLCPCPFERRSSMSRLWIVMAATLVAVGTAQAQHASPSPYSGMEARPIKALSDQQIADLRAGRGMGLALSAELNGYPGPIHVLELGDQLGLSGEQRTRVQELHAAMRTATVPLGERLIAQEADLDRQFATKAVTPASLQAATAEIGATQGALRGAHLRYHLSTLEVLTPEQVRRYGELRGYGVSAGHGHGPKGHH